MHLSPVKTLRAITRHIPGFRSGSATSRAVAITYYAAALAVAFARWPWGVALLSLPFLVFSLADLSHTANRRSNLLTVAVAGAALLGMVAVSLGVEGYRPKASPTQPVALAAVMTAQATATPKPTTTPTAAAPASAATPTDEPAVYVASKSGKVFHLPTCSSAKNIKHENRVEFADREAAIAKGLDPCKRCKP